MCVHQMGCGPACGGGGRDVSDKWTEGLIGESRMITVEPMKRFVELNFLIKSEEKCLNSILD